MRGVMWGALIGLICAGCEKAPAPVAPLAPRITELTPKSMLAFDYDAAWKKQAPNGDKPTPKPLYDATTGDKRTIVIVTDGTEDQIGAMWTAFTESLSKVLMEAGALRVSREVVDGAYPLQRLRYTAPQRQGMATIGLVRTGINAKRLADLFPVADEPARTLVQSSEPLDRILLVLTIDEK